ncbi:ImmA/IrrE family metallo-endopeptidase [Leptospira sp. 85282-16]|uniref:ImmA/IrrE family metallo-endopeptidase n=1 Tax=Leptospira sp. 85282-16 TaxID=2971256 RepID=UPI0021C238BD|nr:ImmA/IrrE family metallo-endopeptidase [Leptospira sp. 85282-16]MCT8335740.1 ImmA/IrrE family metallo-endopeptidase [Leptospira sp. 85282-16]
MKVEPFKGTFENIDLFAKHVRDRFKREFGANPKGSTVRDFFEEIVEFLGGKIEIEHHPEPYEVDGGSLFIKPNRSFTIYLSPITSPLRDNFTIAHELGHYFLHLPQEFDKTMVFARDGYSLIEKQANRFAGAFLMPKDELESAINKFSRNKYLIADHFGVSIPALKYRREELGI